MQLVHVTRLTQHICSISPPNLYYNWSLNSACQYAILETGRLRFFNESDDLIDMLATGSDSFTQHLVMESDGQLKSYHWANIVGRWFPSISNCLIVAFPWLVGSVEFVVIQVLIVNVQMR